MTEGKCQYCGKDCSNIVMHERYCKANTNKKPKEETKKEQPKEPEKHPLSVSGLIPYQDDDRDSVAWFDTGTEKISIKPVCFGILKNENENIPCVLLFGVDGILYPPFLMQGFVGMYPRTQVFEEVEKTPFPEEKEPVQPIEQPKEASISQPERQIKPPETIKAEHHTKSVWDKVFHKKPKETPSLSTETNDLLKQLNNAERTT